MAGDVSGAGRPRPVGRRDVLRWASLAALPPMLLIAGCDIRLEDDAPALPLLQRRSVPDESLLVDTVRRTTALAQLAGRIPGPSAAVVGLAGLHSTQAEVLRGRLVAAGVPNHVIDAPTPTSSGSTQPGSASPTAAVSAPPAATEADLASAEGAATAALLPGLPTVTAANRAVLTSVAAACGTAADQLGGSVAWPLSDPLPASAALPLLEDTRAAQYALVVVAAQTSGAQRSQALTTHTRLVERETELVTLAGASAPPASLGYALPFPVADADAAGRLAAQVLARLVSSGLAPLPSLPMGSMSVVPLVRLVVGAAAIARPWGVAGAPFPGLAYP